MNNFLDVVSGSTARASVARAPENTRPQSDASGSRPGDIDNTRFVPRPVLTSAFRHPLRGTLVMAATSASSTVDRPYSRIESLHTELLELICSHIAGMQELKYACPSHFLTSEEDR